MKLFSTILLLLVTLSSAQKKFYFTPHSQVSETRAEFAVPFKRNPKADYSGLSIAVLHGIADSCFNSGLKAIVDTISKTLPGAYVRCVPIGNNFFDDTLNAFTKQMEEQIDIFADKVLDDPNFANGFNAITISQGSLIARAYTQKYGWRNNYPSISSLITIHGPLMGVSTIPGCDASSGILVPICNFITGISTDIVYSDFIQNQLAQAEYYKDPTLISEYLTTDFLPFYNFEKEGVLDLKGLNILDELVLVKGLKDRVVLPPESSWFGYYQNGGFDVIEKLDETPFYKDPRSGLELLHKAGKISFEYTPDGHVVFSQTFLANLVHKYWG